MQLRCLAFCFVLLTPLLFAVDAIDLTFAVPVVAIMVAIFIGVANMLSATIGNPQLEAWAKTELREFVAALILIVIIIGAFIGSSGISVALSGKTDYIGASKGIIDGWIGKYDNSYHQIIVASAKLRIAATFAPYVNMAIWYVSINYATNPLAGIAAFFTPLTVATQGLSNAIFLAEGVRLLISFCGVVVPKVLLPLSFCLRLVPFTRKLGNTMIAVSMAGGVFLPFSVIVTDSLNKNIHEPDPQVKNMAALDADPWIMTMAGPLCESKVIRTMLGLTDPVFALVVCAPLLLIPIVGAAFFAVCYPIVQYVVYPLVSTVFQWVMAIMLIIWEAKNGVGDYSYATDVFNQLYPFLRDLNNLVVLTYIDFIVIGLLTVTAARSLSAALGGELYMAGIQRLI